MKILGKINHFRADPSGWIGSFVMSGFALYAFYRWQTYGLLFFLLYLVRDIAAAWYLLTRNRSSKTSFKFSELLAYVSSAFPFFYLAGSETTQTTLLVSSLFAIIGFAISTIALFDLGSSFGVSPANRGVVTTGVYKYVRHPMYLGYVISEFGFVLLNPWNTVLWALSMALYFFRARLENRLLYRTQDIVNPR